ncbi:MAG: aminotransferase class V-fold PLP-dependent enzyme [Syntrophales bacterium]|nr:aminotransferase class V-fold PLP-dependent enzyme [Syntrophales bacterium]
MIYFDHGATSFPKPTVTVEAMVRYLTEIGGSPGRSGHSMSIEAARIVNEGREVLARLFNIKDPFCIVFTKNATEAINMALFGILRPGDHVVTSSMEHNSLMRPLRYLVKQGVELSVVPCARDGSLDPLRLKEAMRSSTRLVAVTHASNVTGTVMPIAEIGHILRSYPHTLFLVDAAQTAGVLSIDVEAMAIDFLAFTGHKSLFGPPGTGGLYIRAGLEAEMKPLMMGGTGSRSEFEEQPEVMPDKFESGTPNTVGIAGLAAGVGYVLAEGVEKIRKKEESLTEKFLSALKDMGRHIEVYGQKRGKDNIAVISFNVRGLTPSYVAQVLDENWGIMCRPGLHCAPSAHHTIGTFPQGTVRFSFGYFNTDEEIETAIRALSTLIGEKGKQG